MKIKTITVLALFLSITSSTFAQSTDKYSDSYENFYQHWLEDYENTGVQINEISEVYEQQVAKRGYPKKKTVKAKMALIEHYVQLLQTQLTDHRLNKDVDRGKIERKIEEWQTQYVMLQALLKKI